MLCRDPDAYDATYPQPFSAYLARRARDRLRRLLRERTGLDGSDAEERPSLWELSASRHSAAMRLSTRAPTESELTLLPIPIPVYRGSFLNFGENLDQVARGEILADPPRLRLGARPELSRSARTATRSPYVKRMPDLDFMLEVGPELEIKLDNRTPEQGEFLLALQLRAGISFDGARSDVARFPVQSRVRISPGPRSLAATIC